MFRKKVKTGRWGTVKEQKNLGFLRNYREIIVLILSDEIENEKFNKRYLADELQVLAIEILLIEEQIKKRST